jgi:outer membrane biosynthesis protein TonB
VAIETDDPGRKRPLSDPPASLGDLSAGLSGSAGGEEADEAAIDSAALAALSQGRSGRKAAPDDAGSSVRLADVPAELAAIRSSTPSAPPVRPQGRRLGAILAALAVGFGVGVPVGGLLFSSDGSSEVSAARQLPAPAPQPTAAPRRLEDVTAVARLPLPGPNARVAEPVAAAEDTPPPAENPAPQPTAAEPNPLLVLSDAQKLRAPRPAPAASVTPQPAAPAADGDTTPAPPAETAAPAPPKPAVPAGPDNRSVDALLDQALAQTGGPRVLPDRSPRAPAPEPSTPLTPSRDDVTRAMTVLLPAIRGCAGGESGLATLGIVVRNDGHVENVAVTGAPFEGARSGRCMEGVVRKAKFPRFQQSSFRVQFPFAIQ